MVNDNKGAVNHTGLINFASFLESAPLNKIKNIPSLTYKKCGSWRLQCPDIYLDCPSIQCIEQKLFTCREGNRVAIPKTRNEIWLSYICLNCKNVIILFCIKTQVIDGDGKLSVMKIEEIVNSGLHDPLKTMTDLETQDFRKNNKIRQNARELLDSISGKSKRTLEKLYKLTGPLPEQLIYAVIEEHRAQFALAKGIYFGYHKIRNKTGLSLRAYCHALHTHCHIQSWNYYRKLYSIYQHFVVHSKMSRDDIFGISFRVLCYISGTGSSVFSPSETRKLVRDLKKEILLPKDQWQRMKEVQDRSKSKLKAN